VNKLAKLTGAPSTALITATTDIAGAVGIVVDGAGTSGSAQIARIGTARCIFDGATTAGHYVQISSTTEGDCHDAGATFPTSGGQVLTSGAAMSGGGDLAADRTITLSESPNSASVVGTGRTLTAGTCLSGGGDLSTYRSFALAASCSQAQTFSGGVDLAASAVA